MRRQLFEMAKRLKSLCKDKEEYVEICEKHGVDKKYRFVKELYGEKK